tara:strand:+ start:2731 stop:4587 length:1857 start_codon:yes stop_codon:yes gene_type:complete
VYPKKNKMRKINILLFLVFTSSYLNAQSKLDSLYIIWQDKTQTDSIRTNAFKNYIWDGFLFDKPDSAFILAEELLNFSQSNKYLNAKAEAYNIQGVSFWLKANYLEALNFYQQSLKIREEIGDKKGISASLYNIGNIYLRLGNYPQALDYHQRSLKIEEEIDNIEGVALSLGNIGLIYSEQNNYLKALDYYERSLKIQQENGDKQGIANSLGNIGLNYKKQGNYSKALDYYSKSLKIREEIGNKQGIASLLGNIGTLYKEQGIYNNAITHCQRSLNLSEEIGAIDLQKQACECLYYAYKALGNGNKALAYHEQMLVLIDNLHKEETSKELQQMEFAKEVLADSLVNVENNLKVELAHQIEIQKKDKKNNLAFAAGIFFLLLAGGFYSRWHYVKRSKAVIEKEKERSENLLLNILPSEIAEELKTKGSADARDFDIASILFTDFEGFTQASEKLSAKELIKEINVCFKAFDNICEKFGIEKIKTIGDSYMAAGGLPVPSEGSIKNTVLAALEMQTFISNRIVMKDKLNEMSFKMRLGIHTGPVVAGIVGVKKFQYDIWGDTVNTASRMESCGKIGKVNISEGTYTFLKDDPEFTFENRGKIDAKGKGEIEMYFVENKLK